MTLFDDREHLRELPVYVIRGNHDCLFPWYREVELMKNYTFWHMPSLYYKKEYEMGNGKKLGILYTDSCLMLCSDYSFKGDT